MFTTVAEFYAVLRQEGIIDGAIGKEITYPGAGAIDPTGVIYRTVGGSFMVGALIPIVPFLTPAPLPQAWAYGAAAATAMLLGAVKARYTRKGPVRSGLELLGIVTIGTVAGVVIGFVLQTF